MKTIRRNPFVPVPDGNESLMPLEEGNLKSITPKEPGASIIAAEAAKKS